MEQGPAKRKTPQRRIANQTRQRILEAARDLFAEHGYRSTSMRQVAARANLTDPALYYYFRSKHDILSALLTMPDNDWPMVPVTSLANLVDQVCDVFQAYSEDALLLRILLRGQLDREVDSVTFRARRVERLRRALAPAMEAFCGARAAVTLQAIEYLLFGMLWDGIIKYGKEWPTVAGQAVFRARTRRLVTLVLAPVDDGSLAARL